MSLPTQSRSALGLWGAAWGLGGLLALLVYAVVRLCAVVVDGLGYDWAWQHVVVAGANAAFMVWSEGYRGFQQSFSPRVASRLNDIREHPSMLRAVLAPLYAAGYFQAPGRRLLGIYGLTVGIVALIVVVHALPQPWRAVFDIGVVAGLSWGVATTLASARPVFSRSGAR